MGTNSIEVIEVLLDRRRVEDQEHARFHGLLPQQAAHVEERSCIPLAPVSPDQDARTQGTGANTALHCLLRSTAAASLTDIKRLLLQGAALNLAEESGDTPLHVALRHHQPTEIIALLLQNGVPPNQSNNFGQTPLHFALKYEYAIKMTMMLLEYGAAGGARCDAGMTAFHLAVKSELLEFVETLLLENVSLEAKDCRGRTALHYTALTCRSPPIVKKLLAMGADANNGDAQGDTALHLATLQLSHRDIGSQESSMRILRLLSHHGARIDSRNNNGQTALDMSIENGMREFHYRYFPLSDLAALTALLVGYGASFTKTALLLLQEKADYARDQVLLYLEDVRICIRAVGTSLLSEKAMTEIDSAIARIQEDTAVDTVDW